MIELVQNQKLPIDQAASRLNINFWEALYCMEKYTTLGQTYLNTLTSSESVQNLTDGIILNLEEILEKEPFLSIKEIKEKLKEKYGIDLAIQHIICGINKLKIIRRRSTGSPSTNNDAEIKFARMNFSFNFYYFGPAEIDYCIFIDHSSYILYNSEIKETDTDIELKGINTELITLIIGINLEKIIHYKILKQDESIDSELPKFTENTIINIRKLRNFSSYSVFMGNELSQKEEFLRQKYIDQRILLQKLPPSSPECNPVDKMFTKLKKVIKKNLNSNPENKPLYEHVERTILTMNEEGLSQYFKDFTSTLISYGKDNPYFSDIKN
ncbi:hypothetical protein HZS_4914 [Henneguya salminicola]|nr:hypothetical protein HZS_4914 [Henneguya salminicola]